MAVQIDQICVPVIRCTNHKFLASFFQSDLFSLGIILIELLIPFTTNMERSKTLDNARKGIIPPDIPQKFRKILHK